MSPHICPATLYPPFRVTPTLAQFLYVNYREPAEANRVDRC